MISAPTSFTIYCDGGSRGNPGSAACAFVVLAGDQLLHERGVFLGHKTNNEAEYHGVLASLHWLAKLKNLPAHVTWQLDSLLVVQQLSGNWKVKDAKMLLLRQSCFQLLDEIFPLRTYQFIHVRRELNARADALVNYTLDHHVV